jgi:hypothetical protein
MYRYNPTTRHDEDVPIPLNDARAIEMLSGHPDPEEFIEERRRMLKTHGIEKAMINTGVAFFRDYRRYHPKARLTGSQRLSWRVTSGTGLCASFKELTPTGAAVAFVHRTAES